MQAWLFQFSMYCMLASYMMSGKSLYPYSDDQKKILHSSGRFNPVGFLQQLGCLGSSPWKGFGFPARTLLVSGNY